MSYKGNNLKSTKACQVVVLAGGTENPLYPYHETPQKALLPVLNEPLIRYQIELLERSGFDGCLVLCSKGQEKPLEEYIERFKAQGSAFEAKVVATAQESVCDALREISRKKNLLRGDFLVLPCDVVTTENLTQLITYHQYKNATMTMILTQPPQYDPPMPKESGNKKAKAPTVAPLMSTLSDPSEWALRVGVNHDDGRLIYLKDYYEGESQRISFHKDLLKQAPSFTLYTNLSNPSIFCFSQAALAVLHEEKELLTLKQFAQFLIGVQFVTKNPRYYKHNLLPTPQDGASMTSSDHSTTTTTQFGKATSYHHSLVNNNSNPGPLPSSHHNNNNNNNSPHNSNATSMHSIAGSAAQQAMDDNQTIYHTANNMEDDRQVVQPEPHLAESISCYTIIPDSKALLLRCDSITNYIYLHKRLILDTNIPEEWGGKESSKLFFGSNYLTALKSKIDNENEKRRLLAQQAAAAEAQPTPEDDAVGAKTNKKNKKAPAVKVPQTFVFGGWYGENVQIDEGANVKGSIVGQYVKIGKNSKITNCIIMERVEIQDDVVLDNCIIGANAVVQSKVNCTDTHVAVGDVLKPSESTPSNQGKKK